MHQLNDIIVLRACLWSDKEGSLTKREKYLSFFLPTM
uniref:Uncharacterized protein n=1 Tax=Anguilla anguilla TaxID=7936 RepID=A0A0E9SCV2_ANGAN